jgi:hypothetical protein
VERPTTAELDSFDLEARRSVADLKNTKTYRGGVTAPQLTLETRQCSFSTNIKDNALDIRFNIASKGGGTTSVLVRIGLEDLPLVLDAVASRMPESVGVLSDCAALANKKNLEQLKQARKVQADEKARANSLVEKLEHVEEFVSEKYFEAPAGEDEREEQVKDHLEDVMNSLRQLS